jgi:hypothetical protein
METPRDVRAWVEALNYSVVSEYWASIQCELKSRRRVELHRVNGSDFSRSNCDTADGINCVIVNCVSVRANVEQIRYIQYGVKLFVALHT